MESNFNRAQNHFNLRQTFLRLSMLPLYQSDEDIKDMNRNHNIFDCNLLPDFNLVCDMESARIFSNFCEETCSNLFAFSPYRLLIEREDFLYFQCMADELKMRLTDGEESYENLVPLCENLYSIYSRMMKNCWSAFVRNSYIGVEVGKFTVQQLVTVESFDKEINLININK